MALTTYPHPSPWLKEELRYALVSLHAFKTGYRLKFTLILRGAVPGSKEIWAIS
jgi:hypothetical protein